MQKPAVLLTCIIQIHLNRKRRASAKKQESYNWPTGLQTHPTKLSYTSEAHCVFRGAGLPMDKDAAAKVLQFYKSLANENNTGSVYRVPGLLATSMYKGIAREFLAYEDRIPANCQKVLYTILLCRNRYTGKLDGSLQPEHLAFLDKSETGSECEFLFSAFSAFRVHSVKISEHPTSTSYPHEITLVACADNRTEAENAPSAPWY